MKSIIDVDIDELLRQKNLVILVFYSPQCAHCKALAPALLRLSEAYQEQLELLLTDIFQAGEAAARYNVMSVPTLLFFKKGQLKDKIIGNIHSEIIEEKIKKFR